MIRRPLPAYSPDDPPAGDPPPKNPADPKPDPKDPPKDPADPPARIPKERLDQEIARAKRAEADLAALKDRIKALEGDPKAKEKERDLAQELEAMRAELGSTREEMALAREGVVDAKHLRTLRAEWGDLPEADRGTLVEFARKVGGMKAEERPPALMGFYRDGDPGAGGSSTGQRPPRLPTQPAGPAAPSQEEKAHAALRKQVQEAHRAGRMTPDLHKKWTESVAKARERGQSA